MPDHWTVRTSPPAALVCRSTERAKQGTGTYSPRPAADARTCLLPRLLSHASFLANGGWMPARPPPVHTQRQAGNCLTVQCERGQCLGGSCRGAEKAEGRKGWGSECSGVSTRERAASRGYAGPAIPMHAHCHTGCLWQERTWWKGAHKKKMKKYSGAKRRKAAGQPPRQQRRVHLRIDPSPVPEAGATHNKTEWGRSPDGTTRRTDHKTGRRPAK